MSCCLSHLNCCLVVFVAPTDFETKTKMKLCTDTDTIVKLLIEKISELVNLCMNLSINEVRELVNQTEYVVHE